MRVEHIGNAVLYQGDCRDVLPMLPANSVHTCVTSPPYYGLRDYGTVELELADLFAEPVA